MWWLLLAAVRGRKEGRQGRGRKGKHSGSSGKRRTDHDQCRLSSCDEGTDGDSVV